jgi:alpha/beta superfamily hydrolase
MDQPLTISGAVGNLQATLTSADTSVIAVLCHPHPLYGGNMQDAVLETLTEVLVEQGITCLRFNFRGVGASDGEYHGDGGEVDDLRAVIDWVRTELKPQHLVLGGYSFGAGVVSQIDASAADYRVLVAPAIGRLPVATQPTGNDSPQPVDVIVGDQDEFVNLALLKTWTDANLQVIRGADHFFAGSWPALRTALSEALTAHAPRVRRSEG